MKDNKQRSALISVANKEGIVEFARALVEMGWRIISSGGTADALRNAALPVTTVAELRYEIFCSNLAKRGWGVSILNRRGAWVSMEDFFLQLFPTEMLGHRVATMHAEVHGGILAATEMLGELEMLGYPFIDLVCIDFYDLQKAVETPGISLREVLDKIDIGGPAALAGAAKNQRIVVNNPQARELVIEKLQAAGEVDEETRLMLAFEAFSAITEYRGIAAEYLGQQIGAM